MGQLLDYLIYGPFSWLLVTMYDLTRNYAVAIMLFALVTKIVLLYFSGKGKLSMLRQQRLQPKIQALQKQYPKDKEKLNAETMKLYQAEGVSPMGGCLWMLLPFPVLIMLYQVVRQPLTRLMNLPLTVDVNGVNTKITDFLSNLFSSNGIEVPALSAAFEEMQFAQIVHDNFDLVQNALGESIRNINFNTFGLNLTLVPSLPWNGFSWLFIIPIISATTAYIQFYVTSKMSKVPQTKQSAYMGFLGPGISLWFGYTMPAVMSVYWIANNLFGMIQDVFLTKHYNKVLDEAEAKRAELEARRKAAEAKQKEEDRQRRAEKMEQKHKNAKKYKMTKGPKK
ncbi:MAG: membrane protein insertase YidC [Oscillospiraceae bacterium]|nr:membrane protein insertase YidC [Oscillospiraceae bacterium]